MLDATNDIVIFACSHRGGGNSDAAAELVARGAREVGAQARVVPLREYSVLPCLACRACARADDSACVLAKKDHAESLYWLVMNAPAVVFTTPIYFYGLPSLCKTWVDRTQRFWEARRKKDPWAMALKRRQAFACMVAGQPTGQKLFEGARLTLKYCLENFNLELQEPLGLRGLDAAGDLMADVGAREAVLGMGRTAGMAARRA